MAKTSDDVCNTPPDKQEKWLGAQDAAQILSDKHNRSIAPKYMRKLSQRKNQPVRSKLSGDRVLYHCGDIEATTIRRNNQSLSV